jgi:biotin transport system substrate-specific component
MYGFMVTTTASSTRARTQSIAFCGLSVALLAVSAWITVPLGPVPFTLQTFVEIFILLALTPRQAVISSVVYVLLGAVGLPVFSSMRGGFGVLAGPTGGFLWGFILGVIVALAVATLLRKTGVYSEDATTRGSIRGIACEIGIALVFLIVCYLCGWAQLMIVSSMSPAAAFAAGIAPFIVLDLIKLIVAVFVARAVRRAIHRA